MLRPITIACIGLLSASLASAGPNELLQSWKGAAKAQSPTFTGFSAERGRALYFSKPADWSCSTCHTSDPRSVGRHVVTKKDIKPFSPVANPARFTDEAKVEKWFRRNCRDVLQRECTPAEKGDVLTFLLSEGARP